MTSLFEVADTWMVISEYLTPSSIASLSCTCKSANDVINHPVIWEQQCARFYHIEVTANNDTVVTNSSNKMSPKSIDYKKRMKKFIEKYGSHAIHYYQRVRRCWTELTKWSQQHLPELIATFNPPADDHMITSLKRSLFGDDYDSKKINHSMIPYLLFLGEFANGQSLKSRIGLFGYYSFYRKSSVGHLLSIQDATRYTEQVQSIYTNDFDGNVTVTTTSDHGSHGQDASATSTEDLKVELSNLWLYTAGIPGIGGRGQVTIPCLTFLDVGSGRIFKLLQDGALWNPNHGNATSFLDHLEWYLFENLLVNNYRIDSKRGILRFPLEDKATSTCITKGVLCRASPLFVAEISNSSRGNYIFPYRIEMECPSTYCDLESDLEMKGRCKQCPREDNAYQLTERKWYIRDGAEVDKVQGPGVIGLYPKVFVNQQLFQYESCSQQNTPTDGEMWGFFVFHRNREDPKSDSFELELKPYQLDWNKCQWI